MLALLSLIPGIGSVISSVATAFFNQKVAMYVAQTGAQRDVAIAAIQAQSAVAQKWWFVAAVQAGFQLVALVFFAKCVVWDTIFGWGMTHALHGDIALAFNTVVGGTFASAIVGKFFNK